MSGFLVKSLFTNSRYLTKLNNLKPLCIKTNITINLTRFVRNSVQDNQLIKTFEPNFNKLRRNYVRLYNRENQNPLNKPIETPSPTTNASNANKVNSTAISETVVAGEAEKQLGIFKRFKDAYKKHGKVLIICHFTTCVGWIIGFYFLAKSGFDIKKFFNVLESFHIITHETSDNIIKKIETFDLEKFLRSYRFDVVFSDSQLEWLGKQITGITLKHMIVAVMLYKIFTPLRYLLTLTVTKLSIDILKRRGVIQTPQGSTIKELAREQGQVIRGYVNRKKDIYRKRTIRFRKSSKIPPKQV